MGGMEPPLILIVEDEKDIARFIELELQAEGYRTEVAHDGITGLSKFREVSPNLVILDLMLPKVGGLEVARLIRQERPELPLLILTAKDLVRFLPPLTITKEDMDQGLAIFQKVLEA